MEKEEAGCWQYWEFYLYLRELKDFTRRGLLQGCLLSTRDHSRQEYGEEQVGSWRFYYVYVYVVIFLLLSVRV